MTTKLTSRAWWRAAVLRALYTALAIAVPYFGAATIAAVPWLVVASAAALGFAASLVTSLAGLPEVVGAGVPWWMSALERTVKTFAQALGSGFVGATLLADVAWSTVLQAAALAALTSLVRFILATLPTEATMPRTIEVALAADPAVAEAAAAAVDHALNGLSWRSGEFEVEPGHVRGDEEPEADSPPRVDA